MRIPTPRQQKQGMNYQPAFTKICLELVRLEVELHHVEVSVEMLQSLLLHLLLHLGEVEPVSQLHVGHKVVLHAVVGNGLSVEILDELLHHVVGVAQLELPSASYPVLKLSIKSASL